MGFEHWLRLSLTRGVGPILIRRMIDFAGSVPSACELRAADLRLIDGIGPSKAPAISESLRASATLAEQQHIACEKLGAQIICFEDPKYPPMLKLIPDPPVVLFAMGTLEERDLHSLAIVGTRRCSHYGREQAERFAALLAGAGLTVISGGARGVDSAAHRGAMQHPHGRTIAVVGSGLDVPYPPENESVFRQIAGRGAVLSEFPLGTPPNQENFPRRNRIVSGMSRGVLVVESDTKGGALITARQANEEHGRPVFALPGRVDNRMSSGPHQLIRDGAILVTGLEDILQGLDPLPDEVKQPALFELDAPPAEPQQPPAPKIVAPAALTDTQRHLLSELGKEPTNVDQLIERTSLDARTVTGDLTLLSLKGLVRRAEGRGYVRVGS